MLYSLFSNKNYCNNDSTDLCLALKLPKNLFHLFNEFNNFLYNINDTPKNTIYSKYYDTNQLPTVKEFTEFILSFHLNICSLSKNIDDLQQLIQSTKAYFYIITVSESRFI